MLCAITLAVLMSPPAEFPKDFVGDWRGTMEWTKAGEAKPTLVKMRLKIDKLDKDSYTYQLSYGDKEEDTRPYTLRPVNKEKGHWAVDERNGIVLDHFWVGDTLIGVFTVQGNTIISRDRLEGSNLTIEMITYDAAVLNKSGNQSPQIPLVTTNRVKSIQRAILKRTAK